MQPNTKPQEVLEAPGYPWDWTPRVATCSVVHGGLLHMAGGRVRVQHAAREQEA